MRNHRVVAARRAGDKREVQCLCGDRFRASKWSDAFVTFGRHLEKEELAATPVSWKKTPQALG